MDTLLAWINDTERTLANNVKETVGVDADGVREQLKKTKVKILRSIFNYFLFKPVFFLSYRLHCTSQGWMATDLNY